MEREQLAHRLTEHCPDAWATFYRAQLHAVWRFAYRRLGGSRDGADEVASETFLAAVGSIGRYDAEAGSLERWLFGIARRKVADRLRMMYRQRLRLADATVERIAQLPQDDATEVQDAVTTALRQLPGAQRDVLIWMYQDELSVQQIAQRLNRSDKAAENLLYRARQRFRQAYRPAADDRTQARTLA